MREKHKAGEIQGLKWQEWRGHRTKGRAFLGVRNTNHSTVLLDVLACENRSLQLLCVPCGCGTSFCLKRRGQGGGRKRSHHTTQEIRVIGRHNGCRPQRPDKRRSLHLTLAASCNLAPRSVQTFILFSLVGVRERDRPWRLHLALLIQSGKQCSPRGPRGTKCTEVSRGLPMRDFRRLR